MNSSHGPDIARQTLSVLAVGSLILGSAWVLRPFLGAALWAILVVVSTWPVMRAVQARLWGRRGLAIGVMTAALLLLFVVPLLLALVALVEHTGAWIVALKSLADFKLGAPPSWLITLPFVGDWLADLWASAAAAGLEGALQRLAPYGASVASWLVSQLGSVGALLVQFLLTLVLVALMYAQGESAAALLRRLGLRLGGARGEAAVVLASQAIRGVALGVGVTALVQAALGGAGLAAARVPYAGALSALMLVLCIAQAGPALVLFPACAWLAWSDRIGAAVMLLIWSLLIIALESFLRPWLIRRGADLPLLLIFAGVIGGLLGFGLVGIFAGPVILAVGYTVLMAWLADDE